MTMTMPSRLLYVLSPAKTLDMARAAVSRCSQPALLSDAHSLVPTTFCDCLYPIPVKS